VQLNVTFTGPGDSGGFNANVPLPPPPVCWEAPFNDGQATWTWYQQFAVSGDPAVLANLGQYVPQMKQHQNDGPGQGEWYMPNTNLTSAGTTCAAGLPLMEWVAPGQQPAIIANVTPAQLAQLAYARFQVPAPGITLNPAAKSYVNLPTFVTVNAPNNGQLWVTATLGNVSATVAATPTGTNIQATGGTPYTSGCGPHGTTKTAQQMAGYGPGTTPDCGVVFQQPGNFTIIVTQTWAPTAYAGPYVAGQNVGLGLLPAGTPNLQSLPAQTPPVPVAEIQSVNGGA
jgi:enoyl reductase